MTIINRSQANLDNSIGDNSKEVAAAGGAKDTQGSISVEQNGNDIVIVFGGTSTPFNDITKQLRDKATGTVLSENKTEYSVVGPKITTNSGFYQVKAIGEQKNKIGHISGGYVHGFSKSDMRSDGQKKYKKYYTEKVYKNMPAYSIIPNCIGLVRGRYQELAETIWKDVKFESILPKSSPYNLGSNWKASDGDGLGAKVQVPGTTEGFKLYKDTSGKYGIKDGYYGWYKREVSNRSWKAPMVPGAIVCWKAPTYTHIAFVEAVFNRGKDTEYAVLSNGSWAKYNQDGVAKHVKITKKLNKNWSKSLGEYAYSKDAGSVRIIYSPLCNFGQTKFDLPQPADDAKPGENNDPVPTIVEPVVVDPTDPTDNNAMRYATWTMGAALKVGMHVEIQWIGNTKPDGSGKKVNRMFGQGWVRSIKDSGLPYQYEIYDKASGGSLIAYYDRKSLRII